MNNGRRCGILDGKDEIKKFLGNVSDHKLKKFVAQGMPVRIDEEGRWLAHCDNIEEFFRKYTRVDSRDKAISESVNGNNCKPDHSRGCPGSAQDLA
jgi:hypothetical protein